MDFKNYSTRYREGLDLVLKNISLDIKSHEKIGVVGRTGAGKSSLTLALFRLIEPVTGNIDIDDLNTSSIGLLDLRRRLAIIPQDAALFEGSVRDNLDPGHVHDDTELWSVLGKSHGCRIVPPARPKACMLICAPDHARLKDHVANMDGGLEAKINEGGESRSEHYPMPPSPTQPTTCCAAAPSEVVGPPAHAVARVSVFRALARHREAPPSALAGSSPFHVMVNGALPRERGPKDTWGAPGAGYPPGPFFRFYERV